MCHGEAASFFFNHILSLTTPVWNMRILWKIDQICHFFKMQIFVKLVQVVQILKNFTRKWVLSRNLRKLMFGYHSHSLSGLEPDSEPDSTEKLAVLPILRFSKSIFAELGNSNALFWLDCQSTYNTVSLYAVWRNLDQNWHFRGDLNIEVCLKFKA